MKSKLSVFSRVGLAVAGLSLIAVLYTPIWRIDLNAPQYPEGLTLKIHANDIKGNVDIINGLNHYIGMKRLHKEDFPEFKILPWCIIFFVAAFLAAAVVNRKRGLYIVFSLFLLFGIVAMADFWKWEYNYGHNLDPNAAIIVPGMAYQPPLIGFKQLLNFGAYSIPDTGGWIFVACGAVLLLCVIVEWRKSVKTHPKKLTPALACLALSVMLLSSCSQGPEPIKVGSDGCAFCKMTISDPRFGAEVVSSTGKVFKFDDIHCMEQFLAADVKLKQQATIYYTNFSGNHQLIAVGKSYLLHSDGLRCPMNGHVAAFDNTDSLNKAKEIYGGNAMGLTSR